MHALGAMQHWPLRVMRLVDHAAREHGDREIVSAWADETITRTNWRGVASDARRMAKTLSRMGIAKGDRVATLSMNHAHHLTCWYGAIGMGGILHTINPRLFPDQLAYIANHAEDRVLLYDKAFAPLVEKMKGEWRTIEHYICMDDGEYRSWIDTSDDDFAWVEGDERDPCGLCYTSGTTGNPKGVLYEHRSTMLHTLVEVSPDVFELSGRTTVLPIVPMFHANAWGVPWAAPMVGAKLVLSADYRPAQMCELFREEGVTHSAGVPTVWLGMIDHIERTGASLGSLKSVSIGGSAAPRAMVEWFRSKGVSVGHAWGMTETSPIGTCGTPPPNWDDMTDEEQVDFVCRQGRIPFGIELRIVDDEGQVLPRDGIATGRLQTRGHWVVQRYFKEEQDSTDADGWFDTGDVAALHPDGTMQITDRAKDVIKSGGEWISSIELENAAVGVPGVAEAAAIGIAHPKWDERPLLLIVRRPDSDVHAETIREHLSRHVARWWMPDAIEFVDALPHTATGKLSKKTLREQWKDYVLPTAAAMVGR
ncbi:long-chain fatty acid--CoA ligase [Sphingomonas astaxanthinifaciens]|uniref:Long-chain-fatty-acid--CoA ligase n=1 Tax=Sphingomonas astaxanthinifaciens DSM 22298 TaxID=1123267 RepID=A0ABQ5Z6U2_9SPHN|nr:long-chain fatty acid--CoA ligase [Sphingomonas astaxanthinifaciens]GLR48428.1 long-chain-fatty-acid--CoA ligase [Sphingomonas astaxanthinifaciens DSM 22298]